MTEGSPRFDSFSLAIGAGREVWAARRFHLVLSYIVAIPFTLLGLSGTFDPLYAITAATPDAGDAGLRPQGFGRAVLIFIVWALCWNTPALVLWYRRFLLGPHNLLRLGLNEFTARSLWFAGYTFALGIAVAGLTLFLLAIASAVLSIVSGGKAPPGAASALMIMLGLAAFFILASRLSLTFASLPLGERLPLRESWNRTKSAVIPIVGAFVIAAAVTTLATEAVRGLLYQLALGGHSLTPGATPPAMLFLVDFLVSPLTYAGAALTAAISARLYRDLVGPPADRHQIKF